LSDGLADGLQRIADASGVGMTVDAGSLPIDADARAVFAAQGSDPTDEALVGGDDYELLVAVHPRARRRFTAAARQAGVAVTRIGVCTDGGTVTIRRGAGAEAHDAPVPAGYSHFR